MRLEKFLNQWNHLLIHKTSFIKSLNNKFPNIKVFEEHLNAKLN